jgi:xanthine dehydrogenase iron-sulfur cluster and FAD-binding subunit A
LTNEEIRERMSGNLCRCGAYANIVAAVKHSLQSVSDEARPRGRSRMRTPQVRPMRRWPAGGRRRCSSPGEPRSSI